MSEEKEDLYKREYRVAESENVGIWIELKYPTPKTPDSKFSWEACRGDGLPVFILLRQKYSSIGEAMEKIKEFRTTPPRPPKGEPKYHYPPDPPEKIPHLMHRRMA